MLSPFRSIRWVGVGGIADQRVPLVDGELAGDDGGAAAVAILENNLQEVVAGCCVKRLEAPVVEDEEIGGAQRWRPSPRAKARSVNSRGTS